MILSSRAENSLSGENVVQLLVVGPLPPPPVGGTVSFQLFCDYVKNNSDEFCLSVVDSSPKRLKKTRILSMTNLNQAWFIIRQFCRKIRSAQQVLIFGSNGFLLSMTPFLVLIAKMARKPCYVRPFGGSLDRFYADLPLSSRWLLTTLLCHVDGLIVQTKLLYDSFSPLLAEKVHFIPGYRSMPDRDVRPVNTKSDGGLRLVYVGNIREEKGIFILLESLRNLRPEEQEAIRCDLFGVILDSVADRFRAELAITKNASYGGVLDPEKVIPTLSGYDAMIFPTHYQGEGHPGVLIEAMIAGIPVITTNFRSVPELVEDRVNGLLVSPQDLGSLLEAIQTLYHDRQLLQDMAEKNWEMRLRYDVQHVTPLILQVIRNHNQYFTKVE